MCYAWCLSFAQSTQYADKGTIKLFFQTSGLGQKNHQKSIKLLSKYGFGPKIRFGCRTITMMHYRSRNSPNFLWHTHGDKGLKVVFSCLRVTEKSGLGNPLKNISIFCSWQNWVKLGSIGVKFQKFPYLNKMQIKLLVLSYWVPKYIVWPISDISLGPYDRECINVIAILVECHVY